MRHPAIPVVLSLCAGVAAGLPLRAPAGALAAVVWLACTLAAVCVRAGRPRLDVAAICLAYGVCGAALSASTHARALDPALRRALTGLMGPSAVGDAPTTPVVVTGVLSEDAAVLEPGVRLVMAVTSLEAGGRRANTAGRVLLTVVGSDGIGALSDWRAGRTLRVPALLRRPSRYLNPGVPDFERASLRRGVAMVGSVKSPSLVAIVSRGPWPAEWAASVRAWVRVVIDRHVGNHSPRSAAIVRAVLIGDRTRLDEATQERMQAAGSYHVLAISGGNIAILAAVLLGVLRIGGCSAPWREAIAAVLLVVYAWLVGGGASVARATSMAVTVLLALALTHRTGIVNALGVALGLSMAANPLTLFDPGTWLTFGASAAIMLATSWAAGRLARLPRLLAVGLGLCLASMAAELALFPVGAFVFSRVTAAGLVVNLAAVPLMAAVQIGAMVLLAVSAASETLAAAAGAIVHLSAWALVECGRVVEVAPWLARRLPSPPISALVVYYAAWALLLIGCRTAWRTSRVVGPVRVGAGVGIVVAAGWILVAPVGPGRRPSGTVRVTVLDVGQGDATLVQTPDGGSLLVDAGGAGGAGFDIGGRVIAPALWDLGVRRLTYLLVTHGDADHANGAVRTIRDFRPYEVWEGIPVSGHALLDAAEAAARAHGVVWRRAYRGDQVQLGEALVTVRHPPEPEWERLRVRNDDSLVVEVRLGETAVLLAGDIEGGGEAALIPALPAVRYRVLLAPHHGSATSLGPAFLAAARPSAVVISAGRGNRFGHPHRAVLDRVAAAGVPVYRTDRDGAVTIDLDGRRVRMRTVSGAVRGP